MNTIQMLERLKLGEKAIITNDDEYTGCIKKEKDGSFSWYHLENNSVKMSNYKVYLDEDFMRCKWKIEKCITFISFVEAMKALYEGKKVGSYDDRETLIDTYKLSIDSVLSIGADEIVEMKWAILD